MSIIQRFNNQVSKTPEVIAVESDNRYLTFEELKIQAENLAMRIRCSPDFTRNKIIPVCTNRSVDLVVAILGVLKAGGTYLAIPVRETPSERIKYMIEDTNSNLIVADQENVGLLKQTKLTEIKFITTAPEGVGEADFEELLYDKFAPAYIIYTSGTTGVPKGVVMPYKAITNLIVAMEEVLYKIFSEPIREGLTTPVMFDASVQQILSCVTNGNTLIIADEQTRTDPYLLVKFVRSKKIELINVVASYLSVMTAAGIVAEFPACLKQIVTGGDAVAPNVIRNFYNYKIAESIRITNMYGPTENCVDSTYYHITSENRFDSWIPIGFPIPGTEVYILAENGKKLPHGEIGEIVVAGNGLALEYLNQPELSMDKFQVVNGKRVYRTGDLGYINTNGVLGFSGRRDDQLKIKGYRIEPMEIQEQLTALPKVKEACVFASKYRGRKQLFAFIVSEISNVDGILIALKRALPDYMIPEKCIIVDKIPLTLNGKADKRALIEQIVRVEDTIIDSNPDQEENMGGIVLKAIREILCISEVDRTSSFMELGGDSLQAIRVLGMIKQKYNIPVFVYELITFDSIDYFIKELNGRSIETDVSPIPKVTASKYPVSPGQRRLLHLYNKDDLKLGYNVPVLFHVASIDCDILKQAIIILIERHAILRTVVLNDDDQLVQKICPMDEFTFNITTFNEEVIFIDELMEVENTYHFDIERAPMIRVSVLENQERATVLLNFPHIAIDGWSLRIFYNELSTLYEAISDGRKISLPELEYTYVDYSKWMNVKEFDENELFWKGYLSGVSEGIVLPPDDLKHLEVRAQTQGVEVGETEFERIKELSQNYKCTPAVVILSAFKLLLSNISGKDDIILGMGMLGRSRTEWDGVMGFFMNMLPVRTLLTDLDLKELLIAINTSVNKVMGYQDTPIDIVLKNAASGTAKLFNVVYAYQNFNHYASDKEELFSMENMELKTPVFAKYDLSLYIYERKKGYRFEFEYRQGLFSKNTIQGWLKALNKGIEILHSNLIINTLAE